MNSPQARPKIDTVALFERFPHLRCIEESWGTLACRRKLMALMNDTRNGQRKGFPPEHAMTIFRLTMEHDADFPQYEEADNPAIWSDASHDRDYWKP
jgi:hypothetical protein